MAAELGFTLLTYSQPQQVAEVCRRLSLLFGNPPIALHHDTSQSPLPSALPPNVLVVRPPLKTRWGNISVVRALLAAMRLLHAEAAPQWTITLSGSDYPTASPATILASLRATAADALLDYRDLSRFPLPHDLPRSPIGPFHVRDPYWPEFAHGLYVLPFPRAYRQAVERGHRKRADRARFALSRLLPSPFSPSFRPFGGDAWMTLNRRAAEALLETSRTSRRLLAHYRHRDVPEESYFQTLLCNRADLKIENNNHRFARWSRGEAHPEWLAAADLPAILESGAHFARKFPFDPKLYDQIDAAVAAASANLTVRPAPNRPNGLGVPQA